MKSLKIISIIVVLITITIAIVFSCKKNSSNEDNLYEYSGTISLKSTNYQVAELDNNYESSLLMSHDSLCNYVLDKDTVIDIVADALGKSIDSVTFRYTWIEDPSEYEQGESEYYLAIDGLAYFLENSQTQSTYYCYGIMLSISGSYLELLVPTLSKTEHSCTGDPCSSCRFDKDANGKIIGCDCTVPGIENKCNHSIKTIEE